VLYNDTGTSWTTGPCLAVSDGNALSEDLLKYVPKGGKGEFPVTAAVNISRDQKESEFERKTKTYEPEHNFFTDLVTVDGELKLHNFGATPAELVVELRIQGKPLSASDDGAITLDTTNLKLLERTGRITWKFTCKPGEAKTLNYRYERYVPSR
jgi:hypothetical protein